MAPRSMIAQGKLPGAVPTAEVRLCERCRRLHPDPVSIVDRHGKHFVEHRIQRQRTSSRPCRREGVVAQGCRRGIDQGIVRQLRRDIARLFIQCILGAKQQRGLLALPRRQRHPRQPRETITHMDWLAELPPAHQALLIPVSYTHLRAHETDSYLVCRLLLEKKKKNKKNI